MHETRDVDVRGVTLFGGILAAVVLATLALMVLLFDGLSSREARTAGAAPARTLALPGAGASNGAVAQLPPEPRLQSDPVGDLARLRAEEQEQLDGYGWVDRPQGVVRIPVERAMEIVVRKGLK